jgi:uncharacterized protein (TIGR00251 family)
MTADPARWYRWDGDDLVLELRIQPRASRDRIEGVQGDRLRIRLTAPPVDGQANDRLRRFLARTFAVGRTRVVIESGGAARDKRVRIHAPGRLPPGLELT